MLRKLEKQYLYLLSCINLDGYCVNLDGSECTDNCQENMDKRELISSLRDIAKKEIQTDFLTQKSIENWLRGLPSSVNIDFSFIDIEARLLSFGVEPTDKNVNNYWCVMSYRLLQMFNSLENKTSWFYDNK